jgi:hypothetical protein
MAPTKSESVHSDSPSILPLAPVARLRWRGSARQRPQPGTGRRVLLVRARQPLSQAQSPALHFTTNHKRPAVTLRAYSTGQGPAGLSGIRTSPRNIVLLGPFLSLFSVSISSQLEDILGDQLCTSASFLPWAAEDGCRTCSKHRAREFMQI